MDNFDMEGDILRDALDKIASINTLLGGNKVTLEGVKELLSGRAEKGIVRIVDIGCGNGDMLRTLADFAQQQKLDFELQGIDANAFTIGHAASLSADYPNISYLTADIFDPETLKSPCDIILCTLTLHHFQHRELLSLLTKFTNKAKLGIVINDLHRSRLAYYLFITICFVFRLNKMSKEDGLISILRGFKRKDLEQYSKQLNLRKFSIRWKWAFRYQWIISTI
jgi:2-polyprenyl-3-methyl-5-hydroxy-6-metoxy-1,4-benzoquinol methylase